MASAADVAAWMVQELEHGQLVYQSAVVFDIIERFGEEFTYTNNNGNLAISHAVLAEFSDLTGDSVVWMRRGRYWRKREDHDEPGRQQA